MVSSLITLLVAAALVAIDQLIKAWATMYLMPVGQMDVWPGVVELRYVLNDGAAFSLFSGKQGFLILFTAVALATILVALLVHKMSFLEKVAWTMVFAGGVGNLIDRVANGIVVDYINVLFIRFAVFNFADICVTLGVCVLLLSFVLESVQKKNEEEPEAEGPSAQENSDEKL